MSVTAFTCMARTTTRSNTRHTGAGSFSGRLAVITAVLATIGAIFSYMGGATQANAGMFKNDAAIKKTEAANQWAYYQAKSTKQNLSELALDLAPSARPVPGRGGALQDREGRDQGQRRTFDADGGPGRQEHAADARAPPLGPGHHGAADLDRHGRHRAAHRRRWLLHGVVGLGVSVPGRHAGLDGYLKAAAAQKRPGAISRSRTTCASVARGCHR